MWRWLAVGTVRGRAALAVMERHLERWLWFGAERMAGVGVSAPPPIPYHSPQLCLAPAMAGSIAPGREP